MTLSERIELLARVLCRSETGSETFWANYKKQAEKLLTEEDFEAVLRKVMQ
jgi:hypothetical protein